MYPTVCRRLCAAVVMSAAVALTGLSAQAAPPEILAVPKIGFSGRVRIGAWTPVWVDLTAPVGGVDGVLTIDASSPTGAPTVQYATPVRAAAGARARIFLPAVFHDARSPGLVHLDDARGRLAAVPLPRLRPVDEIIVALAGEPLGLESVLGGVERTELAYIAPEEIPSVWQALEGVRLMIVRDLDDRRMDEAQRQAIRRWVWTGGRLLAMPSGDDLRHLQGPTLAPLLPATVAPRRSPTPEGSVAVITPRPGSEVREAAGRRSVSWRHGRGRVTLWERDGADLARRASAEARAAWDAVLQDGVPPPPPDLEATLPPLRPVPARTQAMVGLMAVLYILAVRRLSRLAATFRPAVVIVVALAVVLASVAAARVAALASREASGLVASIVVESIPGTGHARVALLGRTATPQGTAFELRVQNEVLLHPMTPAPVSVIHETETVLRGVGGGVRLAGEGVVLLAISGSLRSGPSGLIATVVNPSGARLEHPWIYLSGRVQATPEVGPQAQIVLDEQRWLPRDRIPRTEPNHALLLWAFSRLEGDVILKATPAWLVGWRRDPALGLRWGGRPEAVWQLVLLPLTAP